MVLLLLALSVLAAVAPMGLFIAIIWWLDRYDREPLWLMALTFLWGSIGSIGLALCVSGLFTAPIAFIAPSAVTALGATVVAPIVEEPAKGLVLLAILGSRHFDNTTDGFVYGATAGLGFAMTENFLYFAVTGLSGDPSMWVMTVVIRTLYSGVMHAAASATFGASLGAAHFRGPLALIAAGVVGLTAAMGIHALWNGLLTLDAVAGLGGLGFAVNLLLFPMQAAFVFALFQVCLWREKGVIRRELLAEAEDERTLPAAHAPILASWFRRSFSRAWLPNGVAAGPYIRTATTLAMRRHQARLLGSRPRAEFYKQRVVHLRKELHALQVR